MIKYQKPKKSALVIVLALCSLLALSAGIFYAGNLLTAPHQRHIVLPSSEMPVEEVIINRNYAAPLSGWFIQGKSTGAIILLHSIRSDRRQMLGRARFLHNAGYSVYLPDLQAHGETAGKRITWGYREARDVHTAIDFIRQKLPHQAIGIIGISLGGAAALLGDSPIDTDALILESVYSDIERAIENRLLIHLGKPGKSLAPLLCWQIESSLSIPKASLSPLTAIKNLNTPLLMIAGTADRHTTAEETRSLFEAAKAPKQLWLINGAAHENLHLYLKQEYEQRVLSFLGKYLHPK
jgi:uncharacterized protein